MLGSSVTQRDYGKSVRSIRPVGMEESVDLRGGRSAVGCGSRAWRVEEGDDVFGFAVWRVFVWKVQDEGRRQGNFELRN